MQRFKSTPLSAPIPVLFFFLRYVKPWLIAFDMHLINNVIQFETKQNKINNTDACAKQHDVHECNGIKATSS